MDGHHRREAALLLNLNVVHVLLLAIQKLKSIPFVMIM